MGRFDHIPSAGAAGSAESAPVAQPAAVSLGVLLDQAAAAHRCGALRASLRLYGRALEEDRSSEAAWLGQVRVLLDLGQPAEAATWMDQAEGVIGPVPALTALRSLAAVANGKLDEARQWSDRGMSSAPDCADVWLARAAVVYASGGDAMARLNLDKAHERQPGPDTARRCGELALDMGDLDTAQRWLDRAVRADPDSALVALRLGVLYERRADWVRARQELERALRLEPRLEPARLALDDLSARGPMARLRAALRGWLGR